jgi:hypothetical protein|nr:MAG TPA_asm: hypothetical protein [Caudoviricetes sp.]
MRERFYKMVKDIYEMELKKGDLIQITFTDGQIVEGKMNAIRYAERCGRTYEHYMKLEYKKADGDIYVANIDNIKKVNVLKRSTRSKKILTDGLKLLNERIQQGYFEL